MIAAPLHLGAARLLLDPSGALAWPDRGLLAVADLHLEKGSAFAARGLGLPPPYDTRETLDRLARVLRRFRPARLVLLGDSFHDRGGPARLPPAERARLVHLLAGLDVTWIAGNHDPEPPAGLPGRGVPEFDEGGLRFRHQARPGREPGGELSGHFHPKATAVTRAGAVCRPCFVADARRVMLPAFGAYAGGLDVADPAIAGLFPRGGRVFLLGRERLFSLPLAPARGGPRRDGGAEPSPAVAPPAVPDGVTGTARR